MTEHQEPKGTTGTFFEPPIYTPAMSSPGVVQTVLHQGGQAVKLVSKQDAEFWRTRNMAGIRSADEFYRLCATVEALWPIVEWTALLPCTLRNCTPEKHHPSCVSGQAQKLLKEAKEA